MRVLLIDDDPVAALLLDNLCSHAGAEVIHAKTGFASFQFLGSLHFDLVICDNNLPDFSGQQMLEEIRRALPKASVLIVSNLIDPTTAAHLMQAGADAVCNKTTELDVIRRFLPQRTQSAFSPQHHASDPTAHLSFGAALSQPTTMRTPTTPMHPSHGFASSAPASLPQAPASLRMIGNSSAIRNLQERLPAAAQIDAAVLIQGESGTGKELVAQYLHHFSLRRNKRFVAVNCSALSDHLLESELFGYKRGAFTDAHRDTPGLVEEADGGTLFLDEIGEISPAVQAKLLRFLQSKEYKSLGSPKTQRADVRIVTATHRNLLQMVRDGTFREDLYYRLAIIPLRVPPLRERDGDIPLLAQYFLRRYSEQYRRPIQSFSNTAMTKLVRHRWPGNIRELENKIQQLVVFAKTPVIDDVSFELAFDDEQPRSLTEESASPTLTTTLSTTLPTTLPTALAAVPTPQLRVIETPPNKSADVNQLLSTTAAAERFPTLVMNRQFGPYHEEKQRILDQFTDAYVRSMLAHTDGNISEAARLAGLDRKSFWQLAKKLGLTQERPTRGDSSAAS